MSAETQAADDMIYIAARVLRLTVDGTIVILRLTGRLAQYLSTHIAARCKAAAMNDSGEVQLKSLIKHGAPLNIIALEREDAERFQTLAKETGLLFHLKHDKVNYDGNYTIDGLSTIIFRQQDTQLVNSILERLQVNSLAQASMEMTQAPPEAQQMRPETDWAQQIPVGRINSISPSGEILDQNEYMNEDDFLFAVQENSKNDIAMEIILYRDAEGNTISNDFLKELDKMPERFRIEDYVQKSDWSDQIPVGRIDYLSESGVILEKVEYGNESDFLRDIQTNNEYGVPLHVVLYQNADGKTISKDFFTKMDPLPQGFHVERYVRDASQQLTADSKKITLARSTGESLEGTWSVVGTTDHVGKTLFVLESDTSGYTEKVGYILADADRHIYAENIHDISLTDKHDASKDNVPVGNKADIPSENRIDFYTLYFYNEQKEEAVDVSDKALDEKDLAELAAQHGFTDKTEVSITHYYFTSVDETQLSPTKKADILETVQSGRSLDDAVIMGRRHYTVKAEVKPQKETNDIERLDDMLSEALSDQNLSLLSKQQAAL